MTTRTLAVVSAGLGVPSSTRLLADRLAVAVEQALEADGDDVVVERVELREHAHAITDNLLTGFATGSLRTVLDGVSGADGVILVTPVFSASYSGLFKSFMDVLEPGSHRQTRPDRRDGRNVYGAAEDWSDAGGAAGLGHRVRRAAGELALPARQPEPRMTTGPFDEVTPFERLPSGDA